MVCTVINESSRAALECALRCECKAKKTVKVIRDTILHYNISRIHEVYIGVSMVIPLLNYMVGSTDLKAEKRRRRRERKV